MRRLMRLLPLVLLPAAVSGDPEAPRIVSSIRVERLDVFDVEALGALQSLGRIANALHVRTREGLIRDLLLFREGDAVSPEVLRESESVLRQVGLFKDAEISTFPDGDSVRVVVVTRDVWSTNVSAAYSRTGDNTEIGLGGWERNLLGTGNSVGGSHTWSDIENRYNFFFTKRRFFGRYSWAGADYTDGEDGISRRVSVNQPFYASSAPWSGGVVAQTYRGRAWFYREGQKTGRYDLRLDLADANLAVYGGLAPRRRLALGFALEDRRTRPRSGEALAFAEPFRNDRRRQLTLDAGALTRRFVDVRFVDRSGATEDHALGGRLQVGAGYEMRALGSTRDRPYLSLSAEVSWHLGSRTYASLALRGSAHWRDRRPEDRYGAVVLKAFRRFPYDTRALRLLLHWGEGLTPEEVAYVGAGDGLRGFPALAFRGSRVVVGSVEDRIEPGVNLRFFRLGFSLFADAGYAWDPDVAVRFRDIRANVGFGPRFGNPSLLSESFRVDLARGLGHDGAWQIIVALGNAFSLTRSLAFVPPSPDRLTTLPD
jgi:hypothetical protein